MVKQDCEEELETREEIQEQEDDWARRKNNKRSEKSGSSGIKGYKRVKRGSKGSQGRGRVSKVWKHDLIGNN